ncbi:hypothetical protein [Williamsia sp.]|uniref:hypothetical protein n=1 Tax=Williamsia sp. TaxID=1872085 RepID=UPI002F94A354
MLSEPVAALLEKVWPATDSERVQLAGERFAALSQRLADLQVVLADTARHIAATGDGLTAQAMADLARRIGETDLAAARSRLERQGHATRAYGEAVAETQHRLTVVAAMADRDILAGQVVAAATGETTMLSGAHDAAARVMTAAVTQLDWQTRDITDDLRSPDDLHSRDDPESGHAQSGSGGAPMMAPMAGATAGTLAGAMVHARGADDRAGLDIADADLAMLRSRAAHLAAMQPPEVAPWIRLAVGLGASGDGRHVVVVGTSELGGYLRPGTALEPHEMAVGDGRAPELAIMGYFAERDIEPLAVCAATPPPPEVAAAIAENGIQNLGVGDSHGDEQDSGQ